MEVVVVQKCNESTASNRDKRLDSLSRSVKCFPLRAASLDSVFFVVFFPLPPPLNSDNEYVVTGSTAPSTEQKKDSLPYLQSGGKKNNLKGVTKRKQQQIICKVPKTTRGKETTTSSLQFTAQAIYLVTLCLFQAFEGLSCFLWVFEMCLFIYFYTLSQ